MSAVLVRCDRRRRPLAPVPDQVAEALTGLLAGHADERAAMVARRFLDELRVGGQWLMCTCRRRRAPADAVPVSTLRQRHPVRAPRRSAWPTRRTASGIALPSTPNRPTRSTAITPRHIHQGSPFLLRHPRLPAASTVAARRASGSTGVALPRLAPVLFGLLARARFDVVHPDEVRSRPGRRAGAADPKSHYRRLRALDRDPVGERLTSGDLLCTWFPALGGHLQRLDRVRTRFPTRMRPQGLFWGVVDDLAVDHDTTEVTYTYGPRDARRHVAGELPVAVRIPGRSPTGPFWLLAALGVPGDDPSAPFRVLDAYAHPAYSRSLLLPVDSDSERVTAGVLLDQLAWWQRRCGLHVQLHKPWATITLPDGDIAPPPDFLLTAPGHRRPRRGDDGGTRRPRLRGPQAAHPRPDASHPRRGRRHRARPHRQRPRDATAPSTQRPDPSRRSRRRDVSEPPGAMRLPAGRLILRHDRSSTGLGAWCLRRRRVRLARGEDLVDVDARIGGHDRQHVAVDRVRRGDRAGGDVRAAAGRADRCRPPAHVEGDEAHR